MAKAINPKDTNLITYSKKNNILIAEISELQANKIFPIIGNIYPVVSNVFDCFVAFKFDRVIMTGSPEDNEVGAWVYVPHIAEHGSSWHERKAYEKAKGIELHIIND